MIVCLHHLSAALSPSATSFVDSSLSRKEAESYSSSSELMSLDACEESENISESPLTAARRTAPGGVPSAMPDDDCPAPLEIPLCAAATPPLRDSTNSKYIPASTNGEPGGERGAEETNSALKFEESVGEDVPGNI